MVLESCFCHAPSEDLEWLVRSFQRSSIGCILQTHKGEHAPYDRYLDIAKELYKKTVNRQQMRSVKMHPRVRTRCQITSLSFPIIWHYPVCFYLNGETVYAAHSASNLCPVTYSGSN